MTPRYRVVLSCCLVFAMACLQGCSRFREWTGSTQSESGPVAGATVNESTDIEQVQSELRKVVANYIRSEMNAGDERKSVVIHRQPYYLKEYSQYPDGPDVFTVDFTETDSKTTPYSADVTAARLRYSTRFHRDRSEAEADTSFLRDTGEEHLAFEFRTGRWQKVGSLFLAKKTEENVNNEWVAPKEQIMRTVAAEEAQGESWLSSIWSKVTGNSSDESESRLSNDVNQRQSQGPSRRSWK